jgi:hypothetical protein
MTWPVPSRKGHPVFRRVADPHGHACTLQQLRSLFSGLRAPAAWTAVYTLVRLTTIFALDLGSVHDRVLAACYARAESGDARVRRRHARRERPHPTCRRIGLAGGGGRRHNVLFTNGRFNIRPGRVVAVVLSCWWQSSASPTAIVDERVLIFTPGVPDMAPKFGHNVGSL